MDTWINYTRMPVMNLLSIKKSNSAEAVNYAIFIQNSVIQYRGKAATFRVPFVSV